MQTAHPTTVSPSNHVDDSSRRPFLSQCDSHNTIRFPLLMITTNTIPATKIGHGACGPRHLCHNRGPVLLGHRVRGQSQPGPRNHQVLRRAEGERRRGGLSAAEGELPQQPRLRPALHRPRHLCLLQLCGDALGLGRRDCVGGHGLGSRGSSLSALMTWIVENDSIERGVVKDPCQEST